jgi:hypothetical protein
MVGDAVVVIVVSEEGWQPLGGLVARAALGRLVSAMIEVDRDCNTRKDAESTLPCEEERCGPAKMHVGCFVLVLAGFQRDGGDNEPAKQVPVSVHPN